MSLKKTSLLEILLTDPSFENWAKNRNQNDVAFWNNWISENPNKIETVSTGRAIILGINFIPRKLSEEKINKELTQILEQVAPEKNMRSAKSMLSMNVKKYLSVAAISLVIIAIGFVALNRPTMVAHRTAYGEIMDLKLPDGTSVVLNGNSKITYTKNNTRDITLIGEAYFKVNSIPSTKAKFWVNTKDLRVEVYGTQFHVNTREEKTDVILDEGSIQLLLNNGGSKKMVPGEIVSFSIENDVLKHEKVTPAIPYALWRDGTFEFNNVSLKEVMKYMEYTYGLPSEFMTKELEERIISGGIPNQNLTICLKAIEKSTGTKIINTDNKLLIYTN